ncbi:hypothetical protein ACFLXE_03360 [Chloroflexota bacterium]
MNRLFCRSAKQIAVLDVVGAETKGLGPGSVEKRDGNKTVRVRKAKMEPVRADLWTLGVDHPQRPTGLLLQMI